MHDITESLGGTSTG